MKKLPLLLILSRVAFAAIIITLSILKPSYFRTIIITLIALGLILDIFDGIIARKLNVSTPKSRRLDSTIDQIFWLAVVATAYIIDPVFFKEHFSNNHNYRTGSHLLYRMLSEI